MVHLSMAAYSYFIYLAQNKAISCSEVVQHSPLRDPRKLLEQECERLQLSPKLRSLLEPFVPKTRLEWAEPVLA
jgi:hypothetical protein